MRLAISKPICVCFALLVCLPCWTPAQPDPVLSSRPELGPTIKTVPDGRIRLDVVVTDAAGKTVAGLEAKDFTLLDNDRPAQIASFRSFDSAASRPEPPVELVLVMDAVNNGFTDLSYIRRGVETFLRRNGGQLAQPVTLMLFKVDGLLALSKPSTDGNELAGILHQIKPSLRPMGINPFELSVRAVLQLAEIEARKPGRKMVVWLGPGWPQPETQGQTYSPRDDQYKQLNFAAIVSLLTRLREAHITLYGGQPNTAFYYRDFIKGVKTAAEVDFQMLSLEVLAYETGGRGELTAMNRDSDLATDLSSFAADSAPYYSIAFEPPRTARVDEYHGVKVQIDKPGLTAHTFNGYYDQPEYALPERASALAPARADADAGRQQVAQFLLKRVTVAELEETLKEAQGKSDSEVARRLGGLVLAERLSAAKFALLKAGLPGARALAAVVALGDASAFLDLPAAEVPPTAAPDLAGQKRIVALAVDYLGKTIPKLPNLYATRTTDRYDDTLEGSGQSGTTLAAGGPLHKAGSDRAIVLYRDGNEVVDQMAGKNRKPLADEKGLITRGTFGPILSTVMVDAAQSEMSFSRWELAGGGPEAVFRFAIPREKSHYEVAYRSAPGNDKSYDVEERTGYHGEIAIDPVRGTILRLAVEADLERGLPIARADIMVEYGPVDIGGKTYFCPVRSVSLSKGRSMLVTQGNLGNSTTLGPAITRLNDVTFGEYHVFRGEIRVLTGDEPAQ